MCTERIKNDFLKNAMQFYSKISLNITKAVEPKKPMLISTFENKNDYMACIFGNKAKSFLILTFLHK
jgi:hypothetical protein